MSLGHRKLRSYEGKISKNSHSGHGRASVQPGIRVGHSPAPGPQDSTPEPLTVLGLQDVRYLHFLEGTRDYEWLEAMFLNQTLAKTKLSWFRYHFPSCPQSPGQTEK